MSDLNKISQELVLQYVKLERLRWHAYASEAILGDIALHIGEDENKWKIAGLLHDLDIEITRANRLIHTKETVRILEEKGFQNDIIDAIRLHNEEAHEDKRCKPFHHALVAGETLSGFIAFVAAAKHQNKIGAVTAELIMTCLQDEIFAPQFNRHIIYECELVGISIHEFVAIALLAMQKVSHKIGLQ